MGGTVSEARLVRPATLALTMLVLGACEVSNPEYRLLDGAVGLGDGNNPTACSFALTQNAYDGANRLGSIGFKNNGPGTASDVTVSFELPGGVHCNFGETGWSYSQNGTACTYRKSGSPMAPGTNLLFHFGTDSTTLTAVGHPAVSAYVCDFASGCGPESDAVFCSRLGKNCGTVTGTDNCGTSRTVANCGSCAAPATCGGAGTANVCSATTAGCSFTITKHVYDANDWWGTITFKNNGPSTSSAFKLSFTVASGVECDYADSGWTKKQSGTTCTFTKSGATLAVGATMSMNYSTTAQATGMAANVMVSDPSCK